MHLEGEGGAPRSWSTLCYLLRPQFLPIPSTRKPGAELAITAFMGKEAKVMREVRLSRRIPVQVEGVDFTGTPFAVVAHTVNISGQPGSAASSVWRDR